METAKNVILAGVRSVTVHDETPTSLRDLSSQFYLSEADVGKPRAEACVDRLRELNEHVEVDLLRGALELSPTGVGRFQVMHFLADGSSCTFPIDARSGPPPLWPTPSPLHPPTRAADRAHRSHPARSVARR